MIPKPVAYIGSLLFDDADQGHTLIMTSHDAGDTWENVTPNINASLYTISSEEIG